LRAARLRDQRQGQAAGAGAVLRQHRLRPRRDLRQDHVAAHGYPGYRESGSMRSRKTRSLNYTHMQGEANGDRQKGFHSC